MTLTFAGSVTPGTGRSSAQFASVKIVVVAPMPSASVTTAMAVKPGLRRNSRSA
jgi:hypothetical protein